MKRILPTAIIFALATFSLSAPSLAADNSSFIVGTWNTTANGAITITGSDGFYEGVVSSAFKYGGCDQNTGELMIKILGNGSGSLSGDGLSFLGSFQANMSTLDCKPSASTAEFKVKDLKSILELNACPTFSGDCLNLRKQAATTDKEAPTIEFQLFNVITPINSIIRTVFTIRDNSGKASYRTDIYSDGLKLNKDTAAWSTISGDPVMSSFQPNVIAGANGPFYVCVTAYDAAGNMTAEFDNCQWRSIEVPITPMINGCGSQDDGWLFGIAQNLMLNTLTIKVALNEVSGYNPKDPVHSNSKGLYWEVNVKPACDNHDAGYFGATFKDQVLGGIIDTRLKSRSWVDNKFRQDIVTLCTRSKGIPKSALNTCKAGENYEDSKVLKLLTHALPTGSKTYWSAVRAKAKNGFDADSTKPGLNKVLPKTTKPAGGARNNI
jgi:hypothetical protein